MSQYIAFIRGINVGRAKRVAMADLRMLAMEMGFSEARTVLNSGNLIFTASAAKGKNAAQRIEKAISTRLGVAAKIITLTAAELDTIIKENPLREIATNPSRFVVAILNDPQDRELLLPLTEQEWTPEVIALGNRAAYLWCPEGILASPLAQAVNRLLGDSLTTRNWGTMLKLHTITNSLM